MKKIIRQSKNTLDALVWIIPAIFLASTFFIAVPTPQPESNTVLFMHPPEASFAPNTTGEIEARLNASTPINAIRTVILFPTDLIEVSHVSTTKSFIRLWLEKPRISNELGTITLSGGLPAPGFYGNGRIVNITFKTKKEGTARLTFEKTQVLANDGRGTGVLDDVREGVYIISSKVNPFPDLNKDGKIDVIDIGMFVSLWQTPEDYVLDFNGNGKADISDLGILLSAMGRSRERESSAPSTSDTAPPAQANETEQAPPPLTTPTLSPTPAP